MKVSGLRSSVFSLQSSVFFFSVAAAALVALVGCGPSPGERLIGTWEGTGQYDTTQLPGPDAGDANGAAMVEAMAKSFAMKAMFKDHQNVALSVSGMGTEQSVSGAWRVVQTDGETLTVEVVQQNDSGETVRELEIKFNGDDEITVRHLSDDNPLPPFLLKRVSDK